MKNAMWRKSSYSGGNGGQCIEVAANLPGIVAVRDSKDPQGPALVVPRETWGAFLSRVAAGELDA